VAIEKPSPQKPTAGGKPSGQKVAKPGRGGTATRDKTKVVKLPSTGVGPAAAAGAGSGALLVLGNLTALGLATLGRPLVRRQRRR
jgi:hypothetical protein